MRKKRGRKGSEGGANWMDTYGDMVTLLLCFFVLLYSISSVDQSKWIKLGRDPGHDLRVGAKQLDRGRHFLRADLQKLPCILIFI